MRLLRVLRFGLGYCAVAVMFAGCAGVVPGGVTPQSSASLIGHPHAWMAPEAKSENLLYVSDSGTNTVLVYSYPQVKLVGTLSGFADPRSECADGSGNVWIADVGGDDVVEYAHAGTQPLTALNVDGPPSGCSVDPTTGNLAVSGGISGLVLTVFPHRGNRWGSPARYDDATIAAPGFCGYDGSGNVFIDGLASKNAGFALAELGHGEHSMHAVQLSQHINTVGQVLWDGSAITIGDTGGSPAVIYRLSVKSGVGKVVGSTTLDYGKGVRQDWIAGSTLIGPNLARDDLEFWPYPAGGAPSQTIKTVRAYGAAVSLAKE